MADFITERHVGTQVTLTALKGANTALPVDFEGKDDKIALIFTGTGTVKIGAGTGIQGVADIEITLGGDMTVVRLDSGEFKQMYGENKGCILVYGATSVKVATVELCE